MAAPTIASGNKKYTAQPVRRGAHNRAPVMRRRGHPKPHCQSESKPLWRKHTPRPVGAPITGRPLCAAGVTRSRIVSLSLKARSASEPVPQTTNDERTTTNDMQKGIVHDGRNLRAQSLYRTAAGGLRYFIPYRNPARQRRDGSRRFCLCWRRRGELHGLYPGRSGRERRVLRPYGGG